MGENVEERIDEEKVGEEVENMEQNSARDQHARIDIRIDGRTSKKNKTHNIEMSDMWTT